MMSGLNTSASLFAAQIHVEETGCRDTIVSQGLRALTNLYIQQGHPLLEVNDSAAHLEKQPVVFPLPCLITAGCYTCIFRKWFGFCSLL